MDKHCYLEVDVNGEEVFMVDKRVMSSWSGRISKMISKSKGHQKIIFHGFPGGAASFELVTRFCYDNGKANISPLNISHLTCAAHFMQMNELFAGTKNLTEQSLDELKCWTWPELLVALKQCQNLLPNAASSIVLDKCLDSLITRISSSCETSPCTSTSSPDSSGFRFSCETRSSESLKNNFVRTTWWFEDLLALNVHVIEMLVRMMVSRNFDNAIVSKFIFHYQKSRFGPASSEEKIEIIGGVIEMLFALDIKCVSHKSLFELLRVGLNVNLSQSCTNKLESMIGSLLDRATLDNLLVPSPPRKSYLYDVSLVLRFLKSFLGKGECYVPLSRLKKVTSLMDLYLAEIAPDPRLMPSKFLAIIRALPDSARDSFDGVYYAVNLYLEVHSSLSEEQKMAICSGLNYEKLSTETFNRLIQNAKFPPKTVTQALISRQRKLKCLLQDTDRAGRLSFSSQTATKGRRSEGSQQIVLYAQKLGLSNENEKLKAHLQGMQWRVLELEKVCRKMQFRMAKMAKSRLSSHGNNAGSVPKLCS